MVLIESAAGTAEPWLLESKLIVKNFRGWRSLHNLEIILKDCTIVATKHDVYDHTIADVYGSAPPDGIPVDHLRQLVCASATSGVCRCLYAVFDPAGATLTVSKLYIAPSVQREFVQRTRPVRELAHRLQEMTPEQHVDLLRHDWQTHARYIAWEGAAKAGRAGSTPVWRALHNLAAQYFSTAARHAGFVWWHPQPRPAAVGLAPAAILTAALLAGAQTHPGAARGVLKCLYTACDVEPPKHPERTDFFSQQFAAYTKDRRAKGLKRIRQDNLHNEKIDAVVPSKPGQNKHKMPYGPKMVHNTHASSNAKAQLEDPAFFVRDALCSMCL